MASVASQLIEEVTAHAQSDSLEDAREICADSTYFSNNLHTYILNSGWPSQMQLQQEGFFHYQTGLEFKEKTSKVLHLDHKFIWCWNLDTSDSRSEVSGQFWNVVLEKDGEDRLDWSFEKWRSVIHSQEGEEYQTYNTKEAW